MASKLSIPKEPTASYLKKTFGITFPWRYKDSLPVPRLTDTELTVRDLRPDALKTTGPFQRLFMKYLLIPFLRSYGLRRGYRFMKSTFGPDYYPDEFLEGTYLIAKPVIESLSYCPLQPSSFEKNASFFTDEFLNRFQKEFDKLKAHKDIGIEIAVPRIYDAQIKQEYLMQGPEYYTEVMAKDPNYRRVSFLGEGRAILKQSSDSNNLFQYTLLPGVKMHIDVELLVDTSFTIYQMAESSLKKDVVTNSTNSTDMKEKQILDSTPIYHEFTEKRHLVLRLSSPWFRSKEKMVQVIENEDGENEYAFDWSWKVSDIDYLLESERKTLE